MRGHTYAPPNNYHQYFYKTHITYTMMCLLLNGVLVAFVLIYRSTTLIAADVRDCLSSLSGEDHSIANIRFCPKYNHSLQ
jgi:hypothetical protein